MNTVERTMNTVQRINLNLFDRCKTKNKLHLKHFEMLPSVYGDNYVYSTRGFERYNRFKEVREKVKDDSKGERTSTSGNEVNIERERQMVCSDRHLTVPIFASQLEKKNSV